MEMLMETLINLNLGTLYERNRPGILFVHGKPTNNSAQFWFWKNQVHVNISCTYIVTFVTFVVCILVLHVCLSGIGGFYSTYFIA